MRRYSATAAGMAVAADAGLMNLASNGSVRPACYDIIVSSDDTPADQATQFAVKRTTTQGTGGNAVTETALDPADPTALTVALAGIWATTDPTDTANSEMLVFSVNQRATFRWVAAPGSELIATNTADNGIYLVAVAATATPGVEVTMLWAE